MTKLTPAQKRVIQEMRNSTLISLCKRNGRDHSGWYLSHTEKGSVHPKTANYLIGCGLISNAMETDMATIYRLTTLGREIEL